jgi:alpha-beta hydrolase superfamily lysophospholipase
MGLVRKLLPQLNEYILPYVLVALLLFALSGAAVESLLTEPSTINAYPPGVQVFPDTSVAEGLFYFPPAHERLTSTGKLLRVEAMPSWVAVPKGARAWRILYTSKMPSGSLTVVSGFVVAPSRPSPPGGFPVIAWAHATTGLAYLCAPSRFAYLDIPYLETFIAKGYVVAATDYQGLGTTGTLPYLVGSAEAEALLDSVKAAEQIPLAHASNNVIAFGYSEGGQGALFAGQIAHSYSPSLHLLGVVAEAPPTHLRELMVQIKNSKADLPFYVLLAYAWSITYHQPLNDMLTPTGMSRIGVLQSQCIAGIQEAYGNLQPNQVIPPHLLHHRRLSRLLKENDPGRSPITVPVLITQGGSDSIIPVSLTEETTKMMCDNEHDTVHLLVFPKANHGTILQASRRAVLSFMDNRFDNVKVQRRCIFQRY